MANHSLLAVLRGIILHDLRMDEVAKHPGGLSEEQMNWLVVQFAKKAHVNKLAVYEIMSSQDPFFVPSLALLESIIQASNQDQERSDVLRELYEQSIIAARSTTVEQAVVRPEPHSDQLPRLPAQPMPESEKLIFLPDIFYRLPKILKKEKAEPKKKKGRNFLYNVGLFHSKKEDE